MTDSSADALVDLVGASVERTLELAATWLRWDGRPCVGEDAARIYTPNKVIRRTVDHLIDHLAHIEALVAGAETVPDGWHASLVTFDSDWARFTEVELDEARQRLRRLAQVYAVRLAALGPAQWDAPRGAEWTIRKIVEHVATSWYAEQVGDLSISADGDQSR
jgi:hypothetical protein